jgi:RNA polymerase sigma factor (sigma-70 family)
MANHGGLPAEVTMPFPALSAAVARIIAPASADAATDGQLLGRFVAIRDEHAFAELVRRIGPMVLSVCRRVAIDEQLADDAFQAAFVVLARRAADIRPREAVRAWLHGVAVRVSREARTVSARRLAREMPMSSLPERAAEPTAIPDSDALRILDEEIVGLPEHLRVPVMLCELEGTCRKDAAARLGIPMGTLASRLAKARKVLAHRLGQRGIALSAAMALLGTASAAVSSSLAARTSALATASGPLPPAIAALTNGVFRTMFLQKLKLGSICGFVLALACVVLAGEPPAANTQPPQPLPLQIATENKQPAAKPAPAAGQLLIMRESAKWSLITPDGKTETPTLVTKRQSIVAARIAPDGKTVVCNELTLAGGKDQFGPAGNTSVNIRTLGKDDAKDLDVKGQYACWSADGKQLVVVEAEAGNGSITHTNWIYDIATQEKKKLDAADTDTIRDWSPDGKFFLATRRVMTDGKPATSAVILDATGKHLRPLLTVPESFINAHLSPDGNSVLVMFPSAAKEGKPARSTMMILGSENGKKLIQVNDLPENGLVTSCCWSPDGKQIAFTWRQVFDKPADAMECESFLIISDPDGKNQKTVTSMKATGAGSGVRRGLAIYDWAKPAAGTVAKATPGTLVVGREGAFWVLASDGKKFPELPLPEKTRSSGRATISPDGKRVAYIVVDVESSRPDFSDLLLPLKIVVRQLDKPEEGKVWDMLATQFNVLWTADGKKLLVSRNKTLEPSDSETVLLDPDTGKTEKFDLPAASWVLDCDRDGKTFLVQTYDAKTKKSSLGVFKSGDKEVIALCELRHRGHLITMARLSPDGKTALVIDADPEQKDAHKWGMSRRVYVVDIATKKRELLTDFPENGQATGIAWSPDGHFVAYSWKDLPPQSILKKDPLVGHAEVKAHLVIADKDGRNAKTILTENGEFPRGGLLLGAIDWR